MNNDVCICPSFSSYSSDRLVEIAIRVAGDDDDFEFALLREDNYKEVSAAEFLHDGAVFPVFNRDLIRGTEQKEQIPLSRLFAEEDEERDRAPSCSSSEEDDLENVPAGTYCVWRPRTAAQPQPNQCEKSKSTGSASRRWKIRDLLRRSRSDGKESFVFLTPKRRGEDPMVRSREKGRGGRGSDSAAASAHEAFYVRNRAMKEGEKRRSYLPYRRDLVGFFANMSFSRF